MTVIDTNVQPHFRHNSEIRRYLPPAHKLRAIPDVEQQWYQAPGGDYREWDAVAAWATAVGRALTGDVLV